MKNLKPSTIHRKRMAILSEMVDLENEFLEKRSELIDRLNALKDRCPHGNVRRFVLAADSSYECMDCHKSSHVKFGSSLPS